MWPYCTGQLPDAYPSPQTRVSLYFIWLTEMDTFINNVLIIYVSRMRTSSKPACGILDICLCALLPTKAWNARALFRLGLNWQRRRRKFITKMTPILFCNSAFLPTHPLLHCSSQLGSRVHENSNSVQVGKKNYLVPGKITNTPGPVLRPALRLYKK